MKIIRASVLGFCMGVQRAVSKTTEEAEKNDGSRVFTLGSLVHNPRVLEDLKKIGVETLSDLSAAGNLENTTVIIRAHGLSPAKEKLLRKKGARIIDATCPKVRKLQTIASDLALTGYGIFIAGEKDHAEIEGILGFTQDAYFCTVIGSAKEAEESIESIYKVVSSSAHRGVRTALIGQTTASEDEYRLIADTLKKFFPDLKVVDTICSATTERQNALRALLDKPEIEAVIVAGGRESANTRQLFAIAEKSGKPCVLIESAAEIPPAFFNCETIGLAAGASTPDCVIDEIEHALLKINS